MSTPNQPERTHQNTNDDLVRQSDLDDPRYVNRSNSGVQDHGPTGWGRSRSYRRS